MGKPDKDCDNCEHESESVGESACASCGMPFSRWKPKHEDQLTEKDAEITELRARVKNNCKELEKLRGQVAAMQNKQYQHCERCGGIWVHLKGEEKFCKCPWPKPTQFTTDTDAGVPEAAVIKAAVAWHSVLRTTDDMEAADEAKCALIDAIGAMEK